MATTNLSDYDKSVIGNAKKLKFGIVVSEWNTSVTENLYKGAHTTLLDNGALDANITRLNVPGSFELVY